MQPTKNWHRCNVFAGWLWLWRSIVVGNPLINALMGSVLIKVCCVFLDHPFQMSAFMNEDMIQTLPSKTAHEPFANPIRLGCSIRRLYLFYSWTHCHCRKVCGIFAVTIADQIFRSFPPRGGFPQLLRRPFISWIFRYSCMHYPSRFQFHHHKHIPLPEQPVIYYCKVACPDAIGLILQESRPSLAWSKFIPLFRHVFLNSSFTQFNPQLQQFSANPFCSP